MFCSKNGVRLVALVVLFLCLAEGIAQESGGQLPRPLAQFLGATLPDPHHTDLKVFPEKIPGTGENDLPWDLMWSKILRDNDAPGDARWISAARGPDDVLFLAGERDSLGQGADLVVAAYHPRDGLRWLSSYCGGFSGTDLPHSIAATGDGGAVVAGFTEIGAELFAPLVVRLDALGNRLWERVFTENAGPHSTFYDVVAREGGQVAVCGISQSPEGGEDWFTLGLNDRGSLLWDHHLDGGDGLSDRAFALEDSPDGLLVAGYTTVADQERDAVILRLDHQGVQQWRYTFNGSGRDVLTHLASDENGQIWATGYTFQPAGGFDVLLVHLDAAGREMWSRTYDGPGHGEDIPTAAALAGDGTLAVCAYQTGQEGISEWVTLKYNAAGQPLWSGTLTAGEGNPGFPVGLACSGDGAITVLGYQTLDMSGRRAVAIRYDGDGREEWRVLLNGEDEAYLQPGTLLTAGGDAFWTAWRRGAWGEEDALLGRISPGGDVERLWQYRGSCNSLTFFAAMVQDEQGKTYLAGNDFARVGGQQIFLAALDPDGREIWRWRNREGELQTRSTALLRSGDGSFLLCGDAGNAAVSLALAIRLDSSGREVWRYLSHNPGGGPDRCIAAVQLPNQVFVLGLQRTTVTGQTDFCLIALDASGREMWVETWDGPGNRTDWLVALSEDGRGNVWAGGTAAKAGGGNAIALLKYSGTGQNTATVFAEVGGNGWDALTSLECDRQGNPLLCGISHNSTGNKDAVLAKFDPAGTPLWTFRLPDEGGDEEPLDFAVPNPDRIVVTGRAYHPQTADDLLLFCLDGAGRLQWQNRIDGGESDWDRGEHLLLTADGGIAVGGLSYQNHNFARPCLFQFDEEGQWLGRQLLPAAAGGEALVTGLSQRGGQIWAAVQELDLRRGAEWGMVGLHCFRNPGPMSVDTTGPRRERAGFGEIIAYPNPTRDRIRLTLPAGSGGSAVLRVLNSLGQVCRRLDLTGLKPGGQTVDVSLKGLSSGHYFWSLETQKRQMSGRITLIR
ncbi:MAG: T9SS type A sorting domain-containing protein [Calditrichaeota bacterium]|nr:T9SS type A sorting domain-containing protein [Calditrichota bacterium]